MHLFEAMIAAFDATRDIAFQNRAGDFFALFLANLYDKQKKVLGEYFEDDCSKIEPVHRRTRTPGGVGLAPKGL
jgi:mannose-6-phosphate isomerase